MSLAMVGAAEKPEVLGRIRTAFLHFADVVEIDPAALRATLTVARVGALALVSQEDVMANCCGDGVTARLLDAAVS